jgi:hypothetical protein
MPPKETKELVLHSDDLLRRSDVNDYAASVKVYAAKLLL